MKIRTILIFIFVIIIVFASLILPNLFMKALSNEIEIKTFDLPEIQKNIDVEAEKIYLVRAIHGIRSDNLKVSISSDSKRFFGDNYSEKIDSSNVDVVKELLNLKEYCILDNFDVETDTKVSMGISTNNTYLSENKYIVQNVFVTLDNIEFHLEIESKTGKVIYIYFDKTNLFDSDDEEILRDFVKYLDLHIIDDWKYSEDLVAQKYYLKSEKAKLAVVLDKSFDKYEISVKLNND